MLYTKEGFLNVSLIDREAERINAAFIVILGTRQIGKTYGTLKLMTDEKRNFILMRRTQTEADFITNGTLNPFLALGRTDIKVKKESQYIGKIQAETESGFEPIGITLSLTCVSKIRGFSGNAFTDLVYDEFIPESHVNRIRNEGDAFLNAVVTISGNREIEGKPPLRCWLLANSNNIGSPILKALNITDKVESMDKSGQELSILPDRGIIIVLAKARELSDKRKKTSLMKAISKESEFTKMAYDNEFSYNDAENVTRRDLRQYQQIAAVTGVFTIWKHKGNNSLYITSYRRCNREFSNTDRGYRELLTTIPTLKLNYTFNNTFFESLAVKEIYKEVVRL